MLGSQRITTSTDFSDFPSCSLYMQRYFVFGSRYNLYFVAKEKTSEYISGASLRKADSLSPPGQLIETRASGTREMENSLSTNFGRTASFSTSIILVAVLVRRLRHRSTKQQSLSLGVRLLLNVPGSSAQVYPILSCHTESKKGYALVGSLQDEKSLLSVLRSLLQSISIYFRP